MHTMGFNGELHEAGTRWQLLGNGYRAYNSVLMRFHSPDSASPLGAGGLNVYAYVLDDPINRIDPSGHTPLVLLAARALQAAVKVVKVGKVSNLAGVSRSISSGTANAGSITSVKSAGSGSSVRSRVAFDDSVWQTMAPMDGKLKRTTDWVEHGHRWNSKFEPASPSASSPVFSRRLTEGRDLDLPVSAAALQDPGGGVSASSAHSRPAAKVVTLKSLQAATPVEVSGRLRRGSTIQDVQAAIDRRTYYNQHPRPKTLDDLRY